MIRQTCSWFTGAVRLSAVRKIPAPTPNPAPCDDSRQPAPFLQIVEQVRPDHAQCRRPPSLEGSLRDLAQNPRFLGLAPDLAFQLLAPVFPSRARDDCW